MHCVAPLILHWHLQIVKPGAGDSLFSPLHIYLFKPYNTSNWQILPTFLFRPSVSQYLSNFELCPLFRIIQASANHLEYVSRRRRIKAALLQNTLTTVVNYCLHDLTLPVLMIIISSSSIRLRSIACLLELPRAGLMMCQYAVTAGLKPCLSRRTLGQAGQPTVSQ